MTPETIAWISLVITAVTAIPAIRHIKSWLNHKIPFEIAQQVRKSLVDAKFVIDTSIASGGSQFHPWSIHNRTISCDQLVAELELMKSGLKNKKLQVHINVVIKELGGIFASQPQSIGFIWIGEDIEESLFERENRLENEKRAGWQREYAERGRDAVNAAIAILDKRTAKH